MFLVPVARDVSLKVEWLENGSEGAETDCLGLRRFVHTGSMLPLIGGALYGRCGSVSAKSPRAAPSADGRADGKGSIR